jgi:hypothetical protein
MVELQKSESSIGRRPQMTATQNRPFHLTDHIKCYFSQRITRADRNLRLNRMEGPFCGGHLWTFGATERISEPLLGAFYG